MEKKGWREELREIIKKSYFILGRTGRSGVVNMLEDFMSEELDKAREEGREEGINAVLFPKFKRDKNGTLKREGWVNTSKLKDNK